MNLRHYLLVMSLGTALCWLAWFFVIYSFDPGLAAWWVFIFFYASLFLALVGTISVIGFLIKQRLIKQDDVVFRHVRRTFRQSLILAGLIIIVLLLRQAAVLRWWNAPFLLGLWLVLEGIVFTNRKYRNPDYYA